MNDFEGINTGKWQIEEIAPSLFGAICPVCGHHVPVVVDLDYKTLEYQVCGLQEFCPKCNENMFKEEPKPTLEAAFAIDFIGPNSKSLVINCEKIVLEQKSLGVIVDISENIDNIDTVEINGVKFVREV